MNEQTLAGFSERLARYEERMNTHQATQEGAMDRLRADMAERDADRDAGISALGSTVDRLRADLAERDAEKAKRDAERDAEMAERDAERDAEMAKWNADMAKRDAARDVEMAKRDKDNTRWMIGMWVATVVVLGAFVTWDL